MPLLPLRGALRQLVTKQSPFSVAYRQYARAAAMGQLTPIESSMRDKLNHEFTPQVLNIRNEWVSLLYDVTPYDSPFHALLFLSQLLEACTPCSHGRAGWRQRRDSYVALSCPVFQRNAMMLTTARIVDEQISSSRLSRRHLRVK